MTLIVEQLKDEAKRIRAELAASENILKTVERALEGLSGAAPAKKRGRPRKVKPEAPPVEE